LVLDTNVLLAGLVSGSSASQKVVDALQARKAVLLISSPVIAEHRAVLLHPAILARFANLTPRRVELALHRLRYVADEYRAVPVRFEFPRDPNDAMFVELAIAGSATHIITLDPDLLSLPGARTDAGKRFRQRLPGIEVLQPAALIEQHGRFLGFDRNGAPLRASRVKLNHRKVMGGCGS
jgi:putative PIN family toxin of toxin-antitoxin system